MILIPELETVVLLVPRTGSGALRRAILEAWPKAMMIYRHMEADGVPQGYDRWVKVGVVREPVERLWSLYKFLTTFDGGHDPAYIAAMRTSVTLPFSEWIVRDQTVFTSPYDRALRGRFFPQFTVRHPLPETRKSQWMTLRPDLGTVIYPYSRVWRLAERLGVSMASFHNQTAIMPPPPLTMEARAHIDRVFAWDIEASSALETEHNVRGPQ